LNPVITTKCSATTGLTILSQNPPENTNIGPIAPGAFKDITVTAKAENGPGGPSRCITCGVTAQPDCYDPLITESCKLQPTLQQCVSVISTGVDVSCLTPTVDHNPGDTVDFTFHIQNTGDVKLDKVTFMCTVDAGLTLVTCPADLTNIGPGTGTDVHAS